MKVRSVKQMIVASALTVLTAIAGLVGHAQAFSFNDGDLVLAIYGNNTEALYNLGSASSVLAPGGGLHTLDVSAGLAAASVGTNPVRFTVFGHDLSAGPNVLAGTNFAPGQINAAQLGLTVQLEASISMQTFSVFDGNTISKADPLKSFTSNFNLNGAGNFGGTWPVAMQGLPGDILNILSGDAGAGTFTQVGRVQLQNGIVTFGNPGPSAVPLPAGVILFGTGLIGLIGVARRSFNKLAA
ncbi:MAG: hypothetical protein QM706_12620 [Nitrospira sp.]